MRLLKTFKGDGALIAGGKEYPVTYLIEAHGDANRRSATGYADGINLGSIMDLQTASNVKLRMSDGLVVDIAFLGGNLDDAQRFAVNTRLPGL